MCLCTLFVFSFLNVGRFYAMAGSTVFHSVLAAGMKAFVFPGMSPLREETGRSMCVGNVFPWSCLVCCDRRKMDVWAVCILFSFSVLLWVIKGGEHDRGNAERDVSCFTKVRERNRVRGFNGEDWTRYKDGDETVCLLSMCYCNDKGRMPGRHPGALNPVFTIQVRHNVHKLFRALR